MRKTSLVTILFAVIQKKVAQQANLMIQINRLN